MAKDTTHWSFSNDTVAFYVKIDQSKQPQFPIDEAYYLNKPVAGIDILISCYSIYHRSDTISLFGADEPMYFLDSIRVNFRFLQLTDPSDIAAITVYKGEKAIQVAGKAATNGAFYVFTKHFAREAYWNYFRSSSDTYRSKVPDLESEANVVYILNGEILAKGREGALFSIRDADFIDLNIIDSTALKTTYRIRGKSIGVVIRTRPRNLK